MICKKCGELISDRTKICPICGASQKAGHRSSRLNPEHTHRKNCTTGHRDASSAPGFAEAIVLYFRNYSNFRGRATRSEFWWVCLFNMLVSTFLTLFIPDIAGIWTLVVCIPTLSLIIRRLHDIGKSGWWYCIGVIPLVGGILLIIWFCKDSDPRPNQWGRSPKY